MPLEMRTCRWKREQERATRVPSAHAAPVVEAPPPVVVEDDVSEEEVEVEPAAGAPVQRAPVVVPPGPVLGVQKRCVRVWWHRGTEPGCMGVVPEIALHRAGVA
jgi:hypothetical protein